MQMNYYVNTLILSKKARIKSAIWKIILKILKGMLISKKMKTFWIINVNPINNNYKKRKIFLLKRTIQFVNKAKEKLKG